jgi:hypothetical protein
LTFGGFFVGVDVELGGKRQFSIWLFFVLMTFDVGARDLFGRHRLQFGQGVMDFADDVPICCEGSRWDWIFDFKLGGDASKKAFVVGV